MRIINYLIGELFYKFIRLTGDPDEIFEDMEYRYEIDYFNFGYFELKHTHAVRRKKI